jgi:hypothetical protein
VDALNEKVHVLKRHLPYHESDHVLNLAYNIMARRRTVRGHRTAPAGRMLKGAEKNSLRDKTLIYGSVAMPVETSLKAVRWIGTSKQDLILYASA